MWYYFLLLIIIIYLIFFAYIKIQHPFWYIQPVFHTHKLHYWLLNDQLINPQLPEKNKWCNFHSIKNHDIEKCSENDLVRYVAFIQEHYLNKKIVQYNPSVKEFLPYFQSHNHPSFISVYYDTELIENYKTQDKFLDKKTVGIITSRPIGIKFKNNFILTYYVDYLCVDKEYRKKGIAPELIQTIEYSQRHENKKIKVSLFKREQYVNSGIVPLLYYKSYLYDVTDWDLTIKLTPNFKILRITKDNIQLFLDFMKIYVERYVEISIQPTFSNILNLLNTENIFIYVLLKNNVVTAMYLFKNPTLQHNQKPTLECFGSFFTNIDKQIFINGFYIALISIKKYFEFNYLILENLLFNYHVIEKMDATSLYITSNTAYYLYNYIHKPVDPKKTLILI